MARPIAITALPPSPDDDRERRFRQYTIAMCARVVLLLAAVFTTGPIQIVCIIGAVVLPSIAVVIANATRSAAGAAPERPGPVGLPSGRPVAAPEPAEPSTPGPSPLP
jgi:hypothetical protein